MNDLQDPTECNVLFVGRTGVGKSSLINRIIGKDKADTGVGGPVTKRRKYYKYEKKVSFLNVNLYDTWGMEVSRDVDEWKGYIRDIIGDRKAGKKGVVRFDCAVYCIAASGHRVQDFDIEQINVIKSEGIKPIVVLTKCDLVKDLDCAKLCNTLPKSLTVLKTSSGGRTRIRETAPFGCQYLLPRLLVGRIAVLAQQCITDIVGESQGQKLAVKFDEAIKHVDSFLRR